MTARELLVRLDPRDRARTENAEEATLGSILLDGSVLPGVAKVITPDDFIHPKHGRVFGAMLTLHEHGSAVDPVTLIDELERRSLLVSIGGKEFIGELLDVVPSAGNVLHYANLVRAASQRRGLAQTFEDALASARAGEQEPTVIAERVGAALQRFQRATGADGERRFRIFSDTEIDALPEPEPLIDGVAFADTIVSVVGMYDTFKTFVLLDMMMSIATGTPWHGRRVKQGTVLYICAEGAPGIARRKAAWKAARGRPDIAPIHFLPTAVKMSEPAQVAELLAEIAAIGLMFDVIVVDTVARCMTGKEESVEDMGRFVDGCDTIRRARRATVFCIHHQGWAAEHSRGSSALPGAVATELTLERDGLTVTIKCTKQKDAAPFEPIRLLAYPVAVVTASGQGESLAFRALAPDSTELTPNELRMCQVVLASEGLSYTQWLEESGVKKRSFDNSRPRLVTIGYVKQSKRLYVATDALKIAIGAGCQTDAKLVPTAPTTEEVPATPPFKGVVGTSPAPADSIEGREGDLGL